MRVGVWPHAAAHEGAELVRPPQDPQRDPRRRRTHRDRGRSHRWRQRERDDHESWGYRSLGERFREHPSSTANTTTTTSTAASTTTTTAATTTTIPKRSVSGKLTTLGAGDFTVGQDIPAGL